MKIYIIRDNETGLFFDWGKALTPKWVKDNPEVFDDLVDALTFAAERLCDGGDYTVVACEVLVPPTEIMGNPEDLTHLQDVIENEGLDYTFVGYSNFEEIEDKKFHELRLNYLAARENLKTYLGDPDD